MRSNHLFEKPEILSKHDRIPPELAKIVYSKSIQLAATGIGANRIAAQLSTEHSLSIAPGTISHWIAGNRHPRLRNIFEERPSPSLSYIVGANIGDGCALTKSGCAKLEVTDIDFAQTFNSNLAHLFSRDKPNKILVRKFNSERLPLFIVKYSSTQLTRLLSRTQRDFSN